MYIKILGKKKIRDNKVIIFRIKNSVFKIPLTKGAAREISDEKERIKKAKNDNFFSKYLPEYRFFLFFQISPYLMPLDNNADFGFLIKQYFKKSFKGISKWKKVELGTLINEDFLEFVSRYVTEYFDFLSGYLKKIVLPLSSAHGDFHSENILTDKDLLCFIDWSCYSEHSSRYFDLYNYYIFFIKDKGESWINVWQREFNSENNEVLGIGTKKEYLLAYGIWKAAEDIRVLRFRGKLDEFKIRKYINFIKILKETNIEV